MRQNLFWMTQQPRSLKITLLGAIQKLRNGQRGEGVDDFVTYCYVYFEGGGGI